MPGNCGCNTCAGASPCELNRDVCQLKELVRSQGKQLGQLVRHMKMGCKKPPKESTIKGLSPCLKCLQPDVLYHLGMDTATMDFPKVFGDVRFVCMGGTAERMERFAYKIMKELSLKLNPATTLRNMAEPGHRYALYKVGPVLCVSHGMGCPSISILLHELIKMLHHAKCQDPVFIRIGTCGGIGIEPGTVVISSEALDGMLNPYYELIVQGKVVLYSSKLDQCLANELLSLAIPCEDEFCTIIGKTICTNDFYEGQTRLDGAFCDYTNQSKTAYLQSVQCQGVVNFDMESTAFAALTNRANIRSAVVSMCIVNRMEGDQILSPPECLSEWEKRPQVLVARYIRKEFLKRDDDSDTEAYEEVCPSACLEGDKAI
ncbi:uridine phosphorylase 1-like [Drosophila pseudoobscura]|uniref:Uridine phosphorylase n=1 Tax=Drosophila pseudoobscura pseudoobscura TaxID=46245 RepID=A0A6I8V2D0_DROPS|nr:uridine phosphorylase 1 [Drosophila pseudoobscura]